VAALREVALIKNVLGVFCVRGTNYGFRGILSVPVLVVCSWLHAQTPTLTTDWVAGAGSKVADVPSFAWLEDGSAILDDLRLPASQQTFERLDPVTGRRHPVLDMRQAVASLQSIDPDTGIQDALPWPIAFNRVGKQALYIFNGDIFLLDLDSSAFSRLTQTPAEEKDPEFSPNGKFISFVRANDIYVWDLSAKKETQLTHDGSQTTLNGTLSWVYWEEIFGAMIPAIGGHPIRSRSLTSRPMRLACPSARS